MYMDVSNKCAYILSASDVALLQERTVCQLLTCIQSSSVLLKLVCVTHFTMTGYIFFLWKIWYVPYFPADKTHFFPEKCDLNSNYVLYAEGKYLFPNL
jgi:hypothetical protein